MFGPPEQPKHNTHHHTLIDVIPRLHHHTVKSHPPILCRCHQIFVVEATHRSQHRSTYNHVDPVIVLEVDTLFLSATTQQEERGYRQQHTNPLPNVQSLTKEQQRTHQHHHRTGGINRSDNRQRQMLHAEITQNPT